MLIIPALYLSRAMAVSHYKGAPEQSMTLSSNPLHAAEDFEAQGAHLIHLVDLDAVDGGSRANFEIATTIAQKTSLAVQYAEGIASLDTIAELFSKGIAAISLHQFSEHLIEPALKKFGPEKIIFTIRTQRNVVEGRPGLEVFHYGRDLAERGLRTIILRDIKAEGTLHPNFDEVERLILGSQNLPPETRPAVFAFGGIGSMDDLEIFRQIGTAGVIISLAFFERKLRLQECVARFVR